MQVHRSVGDSQVCCGSDGRRFAIKSSKERRPYDHTCRKSRVHLEVKGEEGIMVGFVIRDGEVEVQSPAHLASKPLD